MQFIEEQLLSVNALQNAYNIEEELGYIQALEFSLAFQFLANKYADKCRNRVLLLTDANPLESSN